MKLLAFELRKIFTIKNIILIVVAIFMQIILSLIPHSYKHSYSIEIYKKYMTELKGNYTQEKKNIIFQRYDEINKLMDEHENMESLYMCNEITLSKYEDYTFDYNKAMIERSTIEYMISKCEYFDSLNGNAVFFFDTDCEDFIVHSDYNYIVAIAVLFLIIQIFDNEYDSNSRQIILTTKNGKKKLCITKLIVVVLLAFSLTMMIYMIKYVVFVYSKGDNSDVLIQNIVGYSEFEDMTFGQYYLSDSLIKAFAWIVGSLFVCAVVNIVRNTVFTFFISFICMVCTALFSNIIIFNFYKYFFCACQLVNMYKTDLNLYILFIIYICKASAYFLFSIKQWEK